MQRVATQGPARPGRRDRATGAPGAAGWLAGILAAATGLIASELVARLSGTVSPFVAVGNRAVDLSPTPVKEWAIATFDTADKAVLLGGALIVVLALAALAGAVAVRRFTAGMLIGVGLAALALLAVVFEPGGSAAALLPLAVLVIVGLGALRLLVTAAAEPASGPDGRRRFLVRAGGVAAATAIGGLLLGVLPEPAATRVRRALRLPAPTRPAAAPPPALPVPELGPHIVPSDSFYRIDTALVVPDVDPADWTLRVTGLVDRPLTLSFADLLARPLVERRVTLACVSNPVGGDLIGNATWLGVPIAEILAEAGVQAGADAVKSTSTDGWTCGTPLAALTDGRDALLAVGMNGEPLPAEHGFPVRMVVPGLYGYVSATKWLAELEVTRFADFAAYWTVRGWSAQGPVKTSCRIDVPRESQVPAGRVWLAGVAWAQHTGIDRVEVQIGDGPWQTAELADEDTIDTWRQWRLAWDAVPGEYRVTARATDRTGATQTSEVRDVLPDGATGWPSRTYRVA
ncbi:molybdopterin-dependent oxidoreductase [Naumannella huperziae]